MLFFTFQPACWSRLENGSTANSRNRKWILEEDGEFKENSRKTIFDIKWVRETDSETDSEFKHFESAFYLENSLYNLFREFAMNSLSISTIYYEFTICFTNLYKITIFFANEAWINHLFREFTMNSLFVPGIHKH